MLKEQLKNDLKEALKAHDQLKRSVLGMLMTSIKNKELTNRGHLSKTITDKEQLEKESELNDEQILETIATEVKKRKDSMEQFVSGGRQDLADKEEEELKILVAYMPKQMSDEEIHAEVTKTIAELNAAMKDMGKVIGAVMAKLKGKAEGTKVSKIVKDLLK